MKNTLTMTNAAAFAALVLVSANGVFAQQVCAGQARCSEVGAFAAVMTDFRTSTSGRYRIVTTSIRFQNKLKRDLALALVSSSGVTIDDQGNRYVISGNNAVRGIGLIENNRVDGKFTLRPGETGDARLEMVWQPGREIIGLNFEMEFAVRELQLLPSGQYRLGLEHPLRFTGLANGVQPGPAVTSSGAAQTQQAPAQAAVAASVAPAGPDPCIGVQRCYNAGAFVADIQNIASSMYGTRHHVIKFNVRIRNLTNQQLILGSTYNTLVATDELGNRYGPSGTPVAGMGQVSSSKADPQFVLGPGQSRNASFEIYRRNSGRPNGSVYTFDASLEQLEVLPSQQVRSVKQFSLNFQSLSIPPLGSASAVQQQESLGEASKKVVDLFRKKK